MEIQISAVKEDLEKEHQRWRAAQANYERQVTFCVFNCGIHIGSAASKTWWYSLLATLLDSIFIGSIATLLDSKFLVNSMLNAIRFINLCFIYNLE